MRAILSSATACVVLLGMNLASSVAATQMQQDEAFNALRVIRYISSLPTHKGQTCYGLVLADDNGIPTKVRALSDHYPPLCYTGESRYAQPRLMQWAFEAAEVTALHGEEKGTIDELSEFLPQDRLADVVLPPVAISIAELDKLQRVVIGAGINYAEHRDEVGFDTAGELLLFPKPVVPTGPYAPVRAGMQIGEIPARPVLLLDYEVEVGLVLLEDLDLHQLPSSYEAFIDKVAFFVANDVSDREPIILDDETGYTRGKSHPTYLPIGPWMVHGSQLRPRTMNEGDHSLLIGLNVYEAAANQGNVQSRQLASTDAMLRGPWAIVRHMSETLAWGKIICMRDAYDNPRYLHDADGVIPAGSVILTGTPGGTAIREPGLLQKAELFLRGGFSLEAARQIFVEDAEHAIGATAYLEDGDRVESWVEHLGRQRWSVAVDAEREPYGIGSAGACEPGSRPHPVSDQ
ncbi:MAG: fumarylacetoacetate hydrolase family protein [Gammaproteobacteria bacterium]|nr:fumarylacetoacetate hydrolase family protein [Gammaproteobacteria bacterium]